MTTKTSTPFWFSGDEDPDAARACRLHPTHWFVEYRLRDVLVSAGVPVHGRVSFCKCCGVTRCESVSLDAQCVLYSGHPDDHVTSAGKHYQARTAQARR